MSDIVKLHSTMELFLCHLFGGPNDYTGPDMITLHKNMKIKKSHFETNWEHMEAAFLYYGISQDLLKEIKDIIFGQATFIVNTPD